jgi:cytosine/creatinine deaminase
MINDREVLKFAIEEARAGLREGGLPIGSALVDRRGEVIARGHNLRVQSGDPTAHAETVCIRNAGRRRDWPELTLVSTLSPCIMCTGTSLLYRIPRVIVGENRNFLGAEDLFRQHGVELVVLDDAECVEMMGKFIREHPDLWNEDIGR